MQNYYSGRRQFLYTKTQWRPLTGVKAIWICVLDSDLEDNIWNVPYFGYETIVIQ